MRTSKAKGTKQVVEFNEILDNRRTAIYVRESSKFQANEGYNIHAQELKCKEYAKFFLDDENVKIYREKGFSAKGIDRPVLNVLIDDVKKGKIKAIIVQKLDRLSRRNSGMFPLIEMFMDCDVRLIAIRELIDTTTPAWKISTSMFTLLAEIEQDQISERSCEALEYGASIGSYIKGGVAPFGTFRERVYREDGSHIITLNRHPWQWAVLETIYSLAYNGTNCTQISLRINSLPVMQEYGKKIGEDQIHKILSNKIYIGIMYLRDKEYNIDFKNCMDVEYWNQVQINRSIHLKRNPLNGYMYHGKIMCDCNTVCIVDVTNKRLANGSIKKYKYYVCPKCGKRISESKLMEMIEPKLKQKYEVEIVDDFKEKQQQKIYRIKMLNADLNSMYLDGNLDRKLFIEQLQKNSEDLTRIEARVKAKKKKYEKLKPEERKEFVDHSINCIKVNMVTKHIKIQLLS